MSRANPYTQRAIEGTIKAALSAGLKVIGVRPDGTVLTDDSRGFGGATLANNRIVSSYRDLCNARTDKREKCSISSSPAPSPSIDSMPGTSGGDNRSSGSPMPLRFRHALGSRYRSHLENARTPPGKGVFARIFWLYHPR